MMHFEKPSWASGAALPLNSQEPPQSRLDTTINCFSIVYFKHSGEIDPGKEQCLVN